MTAAVIPAELSPAVQWLERNYDEPYAFNALYQAPVHAPVGLFTAKPDHRSDCYCETGEGEIWIQADQAFKCGPSFGNGTES